MIRICMVILTLVLGSHSANADMLNPSEVRKQLSEKPKIIATKSAHRSLDFWFLGKDGQVIYCEYRIDMDNWQTYSECYDEK